MEKMTCSIIRDLLPLYIDGVVSRETADAVKKHLEACPDCQREYASMDKNLTLPISKSLESENAHAIKAFRRSWKRKKILIACISAFATMLVLFTCNALYQNVSVVHEFFSPSIHITLRGMNDSDEWQKIQFGDSLFLEFDSIFHSNEVINDGNSSGAAVLRILDESGSIVLNETELLPGMAFSLDMLRKNTPYTVEVKSKADFIHLNFC